MPAAGAPPAAAGRLTPTDIRATADGYAAKAAELDAEMVELIDRIGVAARESPADAHRLELQYLAAEAEHAIAQTRAHLWREMAGRTMHDEGPELLAAVARLDRRAAQLDRLAQRERRERAAPEYAAYRDRRELARYALDRLHQAGFDPRDFDAFAESPATLRKLAPPKGKKRKSNPDAADLLASVSELVDMDKVRADTHHAETVLVELLRPLTEPRKELADFLPPPELADFLAAQELRAQARALLNGDGDATDGAWKLLRLPIEALAGIPADAWQPTRLERIQAGISSGMTAEAFPPIRVAATRTARTLEDGNHRLHAFRSAHHAGMPGFEYVPVYWLDAGGGLPEFAVRSRTSGDAPV